MLERNAALIRQIESALLEEVKLQVAYATLIDEEGATVTKLESEKLQALTTKREGLYRAILAAKTRREELTQQIPEASEGMTLRELLQRQAHREDAARLTKLARKLEVLVHENRTRGREFGRLVHFATTIIDGSLSIIRSATQSITRSYGRNGVVREKFAPKSRALSTIEEA
ncbi:MAG: hypothetical protein EBZ48_06200 [Proteobacteria bacterium]|nr:hypothetical protein [Pseudomonadota bacterium]